MTALPPSLPLLLRRTAVRALALITALCVALPAVSNSAHAASSPSGRLAYTAADGLYVQDADGAGSRRIVAAPAGARVQEPRWSPDATHIAYVGPDGNLWEVAADGSGAHALTSQAVAPAGCGEDSCQTPGVQVDTPRWSPDGATLSYRLVEALAKGSIWTVSAAGGAPSQVAAAADLCIFNEGFTSAGSPLFSRCASSTAPSNATYMGTNSGAAQRPMLAGSQIAYSPDGARVAFSSQASGSNGIVVGLYTAGADGSGAKLVAQDGQNPAWSGAGLLTYQVGGSDGWAVHVADPSAGTDTVVAHGQVGGWTTDGGWVYYAVTDAAATTIWVVRADGSGAHQVAVGDAPSWTAR